MVMQRALFANPGEEPTQFYCHFSISSLLQGLMRADFMPIHSNVHDVLKKCD